MVNKAFNQAIYSLLHPVSITAIVVLLWNDHWLRLHYPSWWSGKIGDFAWLVFAPLICAAVLAWILPQRARDHQRIVGLLAFAIIGAWFSLAKTVTAVHALTVAAWQAVISGPVSLRLDPTDLLMLPALWLGWQIWQRAKAPALKRSHLASVIFALGIVATLASDGPYYTYLNPGVASICVEDNSLVTYLPAGARADIDNTDPSGYKLVISTDIYSSADGGLTWQLLKTEDAERRPKSYTQQPNCSPPATQLQHNGITYRWTPAGQISRSDDGGQHWIMDYDLYQLQQDVRTAYKPRSRGDLSYGETTDSSPGPHSAQIDPTTGNIAFAMGWDGVLVRTPAGVWQWASVGQYKLDDLTDINRVQDILLFEQWEAGALIILVLTTSAAYIRRGHLHDVRIGILLVGWFGWFMVSVVGLPDYHHSEDIVGVGLVSLWLVLLAIPLTLLALWDFLRNFRRLLLPVLGTGLAAAVLYLFPLVLWTQGTIPRYVTAMGFAEFLTVAALIAGYKYLRPMLPVIKPKNAPTNDSHVEYADTDQAE